MTLPPGPHVRENQRLPEGTTMDPNAVGTAGSAKSDRRAGREPDIVSVHELMTSAEVAALLKVSPATLCRWRARHTGPRVLWLSAQLPRYSWRDVQRWMERTRS
jgi:hypothetical protein